MRPIVSLFFIFSLSFSPFLGYTQQQKLAYNFNTYNSEIPTTTIYPMVHDKAGNLWIATDKGVVKFDGTNFTTLNTKSGSLYNEIICLLYQPDKDILWGFSYYSKIVKINTVNNSFTTVHQPYKNIGPLFYAYFSNKNLLILSSNYQLSLQNNQLVKKPNRHDFFEKYLLEFPNQIPNLSVNLFEEVKRDSVFNSPLDITDKTRLGKYHTLLFEMGVYFGANNKIYKLLDLKELYKDAGTFIVDIEFIKNDIYIAVNGKNGGIFYGKDFLKNPTLTQFHRISAVGSANSITKDSLGNIWYALDGLGLMVINQLQLNTTFIPLNRLNNKNLIEVVNDDNAFIKDKKTTDIDLLSLNKRDIAISADAKSAILNYKNLTTVESHAYEIKDISHDNNFLFKRDRAISKKNIIHLDFLNSQIRCADNFKDKLILSTSNDSIYLYHDKIKKQTYYPRMGAVNDIYFLNEKLIIFCANNGVFTSDVSLDTFKEISKKRFTKVLIADDLFYFMNDQSLCYLDLKKDKEVKEIFSNKYYLASFTILDFGISQNKIHLLTDIGYIGLAKNIINTSKQPIVFRLDNIELQNDTLYSLKEKIIIAPLKAHLLKFNLHFLNPENNFYQKSYSFTKSDAEDS